MTGVRLSLDRAGGLCRLCQVSASQRRLVREDWAGQGQWLFQCGGCGALYLAPDPTPAGLRRFYQHDYRRLFPFEVSDRPDDGFLAAIRCREAGWRRARALASLVPQDGRVLEVGSGHGGFLGRLAALRPDLVLAAIEPDMIHRHLALDGAAVRFLDEEALAAAGPFDLIVLFHVLEHVLDPVGDLGRLGAVLAEDGLVVVEVPETRPRSLHPSEIHPAHVTCFSADTLTQTVLRAGLRPQPARAAAAALPACLWVEAGQGDAAPVPVTAVPEVALALRPAPVRRWLRRAATTVLPLSWQGAVSRWRHGPTLDEALAQTDGRVFRWGVGFDAGWTMETLLDRAATAMAAGQRCRVADINVAKLIGLRHDSAFRMAVLSADAVVADGQGVVWGLRAVGVSGVARIAGVDLLDRVFALCAEQGRRPYVVGGKREVIERAVTILGRRHPALRLAGWHEGYFPPERDLEMAAAVAASGADCLIAAFPYPRQDLFLAKVHAASGAAFAFGVGGAFDILVGDLRRAPAWVQALGLEWLFRLFQEPRRLGPRYLSSNSRFLVALLSYMGARFLTRRRRTLAEQGRQGGEQDAQVQP